MNRVIGAGPAGMVAAITLARAGRSVRVIERAPEVGHRFSGDFQGLENWSQPADALERLAALGVEASFDYKPVWEVVFYDRLLRPTTACSTEPLFYLVRRGPERGSFDRALLAQAEEAGVDVWLDWPVEHAYRGDIVAIGPRHADGIVSGYVFESRLPDQARCIVSDQLAPAGYAYLLVWDGRATLATCLFDRHVEWREARERTVRAFKKAVPDLDLDPLTSRSFSGFGSVFGRPRFSDEAGRLYVGEAAGLQDPEWGFGLWYAMESGMVAARCIVEGTDYAAIAREHFLGRQESAFFNRMLYERLPGGLVPHLLHRAVSSSGLQERLRRHWLPSRAKSEIGRLVRPRFTATRLAYRVRGCHTTDCTCLWCTCDTACGSESRLEDLDHAQS